MRLQMSHLWKKVQDEMVYEKNIHKKSINIILVPSQRYQDSRLLLQNPNVPRNVTGFSNCAQRITGSNYLDVDSPFVMMSYMLSISSCNTLISFSCLIETIATALLISSWSVELFFSVCL